MVKEVKIVVTFDGAVTEKGIRKDLVYNALFRGGGVATL